MYHIEYKRTSETFDAILFSNHTTKLSNIKPLLVMCARHSNIKHLLVMCARHSGSTYQARKHVSGACQD